MARRRSLGVLGLVCVSLGCAVACGDDGTSNDSSDGGSSNQGGALGLGGTSAGAPLGGGLSGSSTSGGGGSTAVGQGGAGGGGAPAAGAGGTGGAATGGAAGAAGGGAGGATAGTDAGGSGGSDAGGTAGSGGTDTGGTGGAAGTGGVGGTAGMGGGGGMAGSGGAGGSDEFLEPGSCAASETLSLRYRQNGTTDSIAFEIDFTNVSEDPIALDTLRIVYFFSNEETSPLTLNVYDANTQNPYSPQVANVTRSLEALPMALVGADSYFLLGVDSTTTLASGSIGYIKFEAQPTDYGAPNQEQANDYSFDASFTALETWENIVIYQGDTLVWGCVPEAAE
jgi:hypothetical protein